MNNSAELEEWVERAQSADVLEVATMLGAKLKRSGAEWHGPCPRCGGTDRFSVNPVEQVFNCRGAVGGNAVTMAMHCANPNADTPFMAAVEIINGEPAPKRESSVRPVDPELARERRDERKDQELSRAAAEDEQRQKRRAQCAEIFESCRPLQGTHLDAYFRRRKIVMTPDMSVNIRFAPSLAFWGSVEDEPDLKHLGDFPCAVSAIRNLLTGEIIGIHRTYLDPSEPAKLKPPGVGNKAKKVFGEWKGGGIPMSEIRPAMAIGEGIETCASWYGLGVGPDDIGLVCAVAIDNISGGSTGMIAHPQPAHNSPRTIQNGIPDMNAPGLILPPEVEAVYLLGDGDSDPHATQAKLLTGATRYRDEGRDVFVHFADDGADWNDCVTGVRKRAA